MHVINFCLSAYYHHRENSLSNQSTICSWHFSMAFHFFQIQYPADIALNSTDDIHLSNIWLTFLKVDITFIIKRVALPSDLYHEQRIFFDWFENTIFTAIPNMFFHNLVLTLLLSITKCLMIIYLINTTSLWQSWQKHSPLSPSKRISPAS